MTIPYDDGSNDAFRQARESKITKYQNIKAEYISRSFEGKVEALIYGALGNVDPDNIKVLTALNMNPNYVKRVEKFISTSSICGSYVLWTTHTNRVPQSQSTLAAPPVP